MQLSDLRKEFLARGEDFVDSIGTTRQDYFINTAYNRICEAFDWPWLFADSTGTAPLTIADLRTVLSVADTTTNNVLIRLDRRELLEMDPSLSTTGRPSYWYRDSDSSIKVYPVNTTDTIAARYIKVPTPLVASTDTPVIPTRWQNLIVDAAMVEAFKDSEDYNELQALEQVFEQRLAQMRSVYTEESGPGYIDPVVSGWYTTF